MTLNCLINQDPQSNKWAGFSSGSYDYFKFSWFRVLPDLLYLYTQGLFQSNIHFPYISFLLNQSLQILLYKKSCNITVVLVLHPKNTPLVGNDNIGQVATKKTRNIHHDTFVISLSGGDVVVFKRLGECVQKFSRGGFERI